MKSTLKSDVIDLTKEQKSEQWKKDMLLADELDGWITRRAGEGGVVINMSV